MDRGARWATVHGVKGLDTTEHTHVNKAWEHDLSNETFTAALVVTQFKSRDITLPEKVQIVKAVFFPVVMYRCEIWTIEKAEC